MKKEELIIGRMYNYNYFGEKYRCFLKGIFDDYAVVECTYSEVVKEESTKDATVYESMTTLLEVKFSDLEPVVFDFEKEEAEK